MNYDCFSSWHFKHEITDKISSSQVSSSHATFPPVYSYAGFYGDRDKNDFKSYIGANEWIVYQLQTKAIIKKIIIKVRNNPGVTTKIPGAVIKVGATYNNDGDFTSFSDFGAIPVTMTAQGIFILIDRGNSPIKGKYIVIEAIPGGALIIPDIKITE